MAPPPRSVSPGDPSTPNQVNVDPPPLYYLVIDGTEELDSGTFGKEIQERFKWKNLVGELDVDPADKTRLVDATHPFLLVRKCMDATGTTPIPVVTPAGTSGLGQDTAWARYTNDDPVLENSSCETGSDGELTWTSDDGDFVTMGRHTACEQATRFVPTLLLRPRLVRKDFADASHWVFADMDEPDQEARKASLVYVSSHGWLGGFMAPNEMLPNPTVQPAAAQREYGSARRWFLVGRESTMNFQGPLWVVLGQCSTLNSATWAHWAKMMAGGSPVVRGILGYEEVAPVAYRAAYITQKFFKELEAGKSFLAAWKSANVTTGSGSEPWAAIVHTEALEDKMQDFRAFPALTAHAPTDLSSPASYRGFLRSIPDGEEIRDVPPPFEFTLWNLPNAAEPDGPRKAVTPDHLAGWRAQLQPGQSWDMVIAPAASDPPDTIVSAVVEMIHIRPTYTEQIPIAALFDVIVASTSPAVADDAIRQTAALNKLTVTCPAGTQVLTIHLGISAGRIVYTVPHVMAFHTYVWWRVTLVTANGGTLNHDFRMQGLLCD